MKPKIKLPRLTAAQARRAKRLVRVEGAIFAALGCTAIDYRSPSSLNRAARQIAYFVCRELYPINKGD